MSIKNQYFKQITTQNNNLEPFLGDLNFNVDGGNFLLGVERTYCQMRVQLTNASGVQLVKADGVAPAYFQPYTLFSNCSLYIDNELVESNDDLTQCETIQVREMASEPLIQNVLVNTVMGNFDFENRQADVISDPLTGLPTRKLTNYELTFCVPNSIFKTKATIPCPAGTSIQIRFSVNPSYNKEVVQTVAVGQSNYKFTVKEFYLYAHILETNVSNGNYETVDYTRIKMQNYDMKGLGKQMIPFTVEDNTYKVSVAFQNNAVSSDPYYTSTLFVDPVAHKELKLKNFQINYKNLNSPATVQELTFLSGTDYTTKLYFENLLQSDSLFKQGAALSLEMFHASGPYYSQNVYNPNGVMSPLLRLNLDFGTTNVDDLRALLFTHHRHSITFSVEQNRLKFKKV